MPTRRKYGTINAIYTSLTNASYYINLNKREHVPKQEPFYCDCIPKKLTSRPQKRLCTYPYNSRDESESRVFDGSQEGNSTERQNLLTIILNPAAGQLRMVAR